MPLITEQLKNATFILLKKDSKAPYGDKWHEHKATDQELIDWPGNLGFLCGSDKIHVLDLDNKSNPYFDEIKQVLDKFDTLTIKTTSNGRHYYFKVENNYPDFGAYHPLKYKGADIGEYRQYNCYVVAPGSIVNGNTYEIINDKPLRIETATNILNEIMDVLKKHGNEPIVKKEDTTETPPDESRSAREFGEVVKLIRKGYSHDDVFKKMMSFSKWEKAGAQYREHTYRNAKRILEKEEATQITLPFDGKLIDSFAEQVGEILGKTNKFFYRSDIKEIVKIDEDSFSIINPSEFITIVDRHMCPGVFVKNKVDDGDKTEETPEFIFKPRSMSTELSRIVLASETFHKCLPEISRIFSCPIPIMVGKELTFPQKGYDERFKSWLALDAPEIENPKMSLAEAKKILYDMFQEFCFETEQDKVNAIAGLISPYLRGIYPTFTTRTPVFFYIANRERAGKDYLAGITGLVIEGTKNEDKPLANADKNSGNNSDEFGKRLIGAFIKGRKRMHFANNKGHIDNSVFEEITTAEIHSDRLLGTNTDVTFDNEMDFSLSGNIGITYTADFANRCRFIRLFLDIEDANSRKFTNPDLHGWVKKNRGKILSALYTLVRNWIEKGSPEGSTPFASFPEWARICGGILETAEIGNPCIADKSLIGYSSNPEVDEIKSLFQDCYLKYPDLVISRDNIIEVAKEQGLFDWLDLNNMINQSGKMKFGKILQKYQRRLFSDSDNNNIRLIIINPDVRPSRMQYKFVREEPKIILAEFNKKEVLQ